MLLPVFQAPPISHSPLTNEGVLPVPLPVSVGNVALKGDGKGGGGGGLASFTSDLDTHPNWPPTL